MAPRRRVIKLGGSLLDWVEWPNRFQTWLADQPVCVNLLVVGGGACVESIRQLDQRFDLLPEFAHWLAIDAMSLTARLASQILGAEVIRDIAAAPPTTGLGGAPVVFDVADFCRSDRSADGSPLSRDWRTTSDSIAARVACAWHAEELILLKSADPPLPCTLGTAVIRGYVDPCFPEQVARIPRVLVQNLRTAPAGSWRLSGQLLVVDK